MMLIMIAEFERLLGVDAIIRNNRNTGLLINCWEIPVMLFNSDCPVSSHSRWGGG